FTIEEAKMLTNAANSLSFDHIRRNTGAVFDWWRLLLWVGILAALAIAVSVIYRQYNAANKRKTEERRLNRKASLQNEENSYERVKVLRSLCQSYNPAIQMIQGETGTQSRSDGAGALKGGAWTPLKQAKYLARHMMSDFFSDVMFASYFSCMDMIEALNGTVGDKASYLDYGYFGVLGASFDENGVATGEYTPKPSYYAMQTIASIFREDFSLVDLPVLSFSASSPRLLRYEDVCRGDVFSHGFRKPNGSAAYVYWKASELLTTTYESTISFEVSALPKKMELIDLVDGTVYEIPEDQIEDCGYYRKLLHLPLRDYPLLLTFGDFR
ncbi:MAG: hypothetical protein IKX48_02585, partial [Victivallales bacterium]|nr:hypothetical protein [Victivallales bacterium]